MAASYHPRATDESILAGIALALVLFAGLRALERRDGGLTRRALTVSRDRRLLTGIAAAAILVVIGAKMLLSYWFHVPPLISLGAIVACLAPAIYFSVRHKKASAPTEA